MAAVDQRSLLVDVQKACQDFTGGADRATAPVNCKATTAKREQRRPVRSAVRNMASIIRKFKEAAASISAICRQAAPAMNAWSEICVNGRVARFRRGTRIKFPASLPVILRNRAVAPRGLMASSPVRPRLARRGRPW
jgi:hypothetical protein